jgi:hypothetical protein
VVKPYIVARFSSPPSSEAGQGYAQVRRGLKPSARPMALWVAGLLAILGASATARARVDCRVGLETGWGL